MDDLFTETVLSFIGAWTERRKAYFAAQFPGRGWDPEDELRMRPWKHGVKVTTATSVMAFIKFDGSIWAAACWARPAKTQRGSIYDASGGMDAVDVHGVRALPNPRHGYVRGQNGVVF